MGSTPPAPESPHPLTLSLHNLDRKVGAKIKVSVKAINVLVVRE